MMDASAAAKATYVSFDLKNLSFCSTSGMREERTVMSLDS